MSIRLQLRGRWGGRGMRGIDLHLIPLSKYLILGGFFRFGVLV